MPPVPCVSVIAAAALYGHLTEPAAQVNDPRLSPAPSLSVVVVVVAAAAAAAAAAAEFFFSNLWLK